MSSLRAREIGLLLLVFSFASVVRGEEPEKVTICQLKGNPAAYDHKLLEVAGFVSHGFENFTLFDPDCPSSPDTWLEYGGMISSGTLYCCGVSTERTRRQQLVVEHVSIPLLDDQLFHEFDRLIQRPPDSVVHATVVGRFFSGRQIHLRSGVVVWGGYGHLGCYSLMAIQQVLSVDPQERQDLDYRASAEEPNGDRVGCRYRYLLPSVPYGQTIEAQRQAELGQREWAFDDPQRVASDALARLLKIAENSITGINGTRQTQGRIVYEWSPAGKRVSRMVVVSRPYWLSFYSKDAKRVAWVVIAAYESSCGQGNAATSIR
jgi:hypothetical protein